MRLTASEKAEIIRIVARSHEGITRALKTLNIPKRSFYNWYNLYQQFGEQGLEPKKRTSQQWNTIPQEEKNLVIEMALEHQALSPRELAIKITDEQQVFISESSAYRILKEKGLIQQHEHEIIMAGKEFKDKTWFVNQMWQTDFTYFRIIAWGWYYLSTIIDDFSRYIVHWELCENMKAIDVTKTVQKALIKANIKPLNAPKLLSDNGPCYLAAELKEYLENKNINHIHGRPLHPQTQGKIERYHKSIKNEVKLQHYFCPSELKNAIEKFVNYYNNERYHESLQNLTPADVYFGRGEQILKIRQNIKKQTIINRREKYYYKKTRSVNI